MTSTNHLAVGSPMVVTHPLRLSSGTHAIIPHVFAATRFVGFNDGVTWDPPRKEADLLAAYRSNCEGWRAGTDDVFTIESHAGEFIRRISIGRTEAEGHLVLHVHRLTRT